jgi:uncharacterized protein (DUF1778 family)
MIRKPMTIRLSDEEKALVEEAAWLRKKRPAEWIRGVIVATAQRTIEQEKK